MNEAQETALPMRRACQIHRYKSGARCTAINEARETALPETTEVDEAIRCFLGLVGAPCAQRVFRTCVCPRT